MLPLRNVLESPFEGNLKSLHIEAAIREEKMYMAKLHSALRKKVPECTCYSCIEGSEEELTQSAVLARAIENDQPMAFAAVFDTGVMKIKLYDTKEAAEDTLGDLISQHVDYLINTGNQTADKLYDILKPVIENKKDGWVQMAKEMWNDHFPDTSLTIQVLPVLVTRKL